MESLMESLMNSLMESLMESLTNSLMISLMESLTISLMIGHREHASDSRLSTLPKSLMIHALGRGSSKGFRGSRCCCALSA